MRKRVGSMAGPDTTSECSLTVNIISSLDFITIDSIR